MTSPYDFNKFLDVFEATGKTKFGAHFKVYEQDKHLLNKLFVYFFKDVEGANRLGMDLEKGLLLSGSVGTGKTSIFYLFRDFMHYEHKFAIRPCREISFEFIDDGFSVILNYSRFYFNKDKPRLVCFDDLGTERSLKFYGNECNVMAEILLSRYDYFISHGMQTYITTNLNSEEIEQTYGLRVRSRMREMFNLLSFERGFGDKR
jgi:DNA replication protein DnaC